MDMLAWNNSIEPSCSSWCAATVKVKRDSWGYSYSTVRGEILGFVEDGLLRKHLPKMFSLIKNES